MQVCICVCVCSRAHAWSCSSSITRTELSISSQGNAGGPDLPGRGWFPLSSPLASVRLLSPFRTLCSPPGDKQVQDVMPAAIRDPGVHLSLQPGGCPEPSPPGQGGSWSTGVRGCREVGPGATRLSSGAGLTKTGQQLIFSHKSQVGFSLSSLTVPSCCHL